jgi:hypothetical protein
MKSGPDRSGRSMRVGPTRQAWRIAKLVQENNDAPISRQRIFVKNLSYSLEKSIIFSAID